jgi:hypothetical protein
MTKFLQNISKAEIAAGAPGRMIVLGFDRQPIRNDDGSVNFIDLYSSDSEIARKQNRRVQDRRLAMKGRGKVTAVELEGDAVEMLTVLTAGWGTISKADGDKSGVVTHDTDFNADAARAFFANPDNAEVRAQADEFAAERANFSKALSNNSAATQSTLSAKAVS